MYRIICSFLLLTMAAGFDRQSNADYQFRRKALAAKTNGGIVLLFASTQVQGPDALREFLQNDNFFYLTGWSDPGGALLVAPVREARGDLAALPYTEILFLPKRNPWQERWTGPRLGPEDPEARQLTGFDRVEAL